MKPAFKSLWTHSIVFTGFTDLEVTFQDTVKTEINNAYNGLNSGYILYSIPGVYQIPVFVNEC